MDATPDMKAENLLPWGDTRIAYRPTTIRAKRRRFLIVSEGSETEPIYFKTFERILPSGTVNIEVCGTGRNTLSLVNEIAAIQAQKEKILEYTFDEVWAVFDKDSFKRENFDNAIHSCKAHCYGAAWSNECFEVWYLLHFNDRQTGLDRKELFKLIEKGFHIKGYRRLKGEKGRTLHEEMAKHKNQMTAIKRAKKLFEAMNPVRKEPLEPPSRQNPCTTVYQLVEKLLACRLPEKN